MSVSIRGCCVCCPTREKLMTAIRRRAPVGHFRVLRSVAKCVEGTGDLRRFKNFQESIRQYSDHIVTEWSPFSVWDSERLTKRLPPLTEYQGESVKSTMNHWTGWEKKPIKIQKDRRIHPVLDSSNINLFYHLTLKSLSFFKKYNRSQLLPDILLGWQRSGVKL